MPHAVTGETELRQSFCMEHCSEHRHLMQDFKPKPLLHLNLHLTPAALGRVHIDNHQHKAAWQIHLARGGSNTNVSSHQGLLTCGWSWQLGSRGHFSIARACTHCVKHTNDMNECRSAIAVVSQEAVALPAQQARFIRDAQNM